MIDISKLLKLPKEYCWSIGVTRLGITCRIFQKRQYADKDFCITSTGENIQSAIDQCILDFEDKNRM